jgi:hypothetical protein
MAVLLIECGDCRHRYRSLVVEGTRPPQVWMCSSCGSDRAAPLGRVDAAGHPWAGECMDGCCA